MHCDQIDTAIAELCLRHLFSNLIIKHVIILLTVDDDGGGGGDRVRIRQSVAAAAF